MDQLPSQLKKARIRKGYSQQQVADKLRVTRQSISSWENGHSRPDLYNLTLLSKVYDEPLDNFVKDNHSFDLQIESDREEFLHFFNLLQQKELEKIKRIDLYLSIIIMILGLIPILGIIPSFFVVWQQSHRTFKSPLWWSSLISLAISIILSMLLIYLTVSHHWFNLIPSIS
ncbi:helix-turn-helix domain-containing protein [Lentilactobacillus hilgardii]|uniref:Helix-turn-helix domain-containing protein n=1 Tax=Lentilactobacillus hilgardii TaxID=1588 RepID=A0A6P1E556_LENHI|nr:helix-turn-helix domain-containing protein [Lentilactobacillus hilgardii]MCT3392165.1 helix-turn-helix domain-containing protein [Lentilactobacillus hilgardii]QHB50805.1 helix-turn-helix domain-containing protein [Lentilactobacillus hilgardii]RRG11527.1 MAG: helix-turn-helix domain-containing protein [Lactobacillus sp.]